MNKIFTIIYVLPTQEKGFILLSSDILRYKCFINLNDKFAALKKVNIILQMKK